jgi:CheY-like chemotaxis protein
MHHQTILLADDDLDDQELLEEAFLQIDPSAQIHTVSSGTEVFDYLKNCNDTDLPCLIVLDYNMPFLTGPQILEAINQQTRYQHIPKLIWSTSDGLHYRQLSKEKGAIEYFHKPLNYEGMKILASKMLRFCQRLMLQ